MPDAMMPTAPRAPFGRREATPRLPTPDSQLPTYYALPALKPSDWRLLIAGYFFVGGLAGSAQLIAALADLLGSPSDRRIVRAGRYVAAGGAALCPVFLIKDLHTPERWYNMLRIFRPTSPMSIGSWTLTVFGTASGLLALCQAIEDATGSPAARRLARRFGLPAAAGGAVMSVYTGALLAATSTPLWAALERHLPAMFAASSMSNATAAIALALEAGGGTGRSAGRLRALTVITGLANAALAWSAERHLKQRGLSTPLEQQPTATILRIAGLGLSTAVPIGIHTFETITGRRSRLLSALAPASSLAGGFVERTVMILAGKESARRPVDAFRFSGSPDADTTAARQADEQARREAEHRRKTARRSPETGAYPGQPGRLDTSRAPAPKDVPADLSPPDQLARARDLLDRALKQSGSDLGDEVDAAESTIARVRDALIDQLRRTPTPEAAEPVRAALDKANLILSLLIGVEYPSGGVQKKVLEQARTELQILLDQGLA